MEIDLQEPAPLGCNGGLLLPASHLEKLDAPFPPDSAEMGYLKACGLSPGM
jgi:hypothetical protein